MPGLSMSQERKGTGGPHGNEEQRRLRPEQSSKSHRQASRDWKNSGVLELYFPRLLGPGKEQIIAVGGDCNKEEKRHGGPEDGNGFSEHDGWVICSEGTQRRQP